ncbi:MAG: transposase family protein [Actinomycetia bacterium]|nr:transposase family protein [Actinomycetes bacterium]
MLDREPVSPRPDDNGTNEAVEGAEAKGKPVEANYKNHVWQVDLTVVPTSGFWVPWLPFALPQAWPFCWWVACVIDQHSRRVMGFTVFAKQPTSNEVRSFLGRAISRNDSSPRYIISDLGSQFDCPGYRAWCERKDIIPRYASKASIRATAIIERFFLSLKNEMLRRVAIPFRRDGLRRQMTNYLGWYHEFRPHQSLGGRTPHEVYEGKKPANERVRFEPRPCWPVDSPCARPVVRPKKGGVGELTLAVTFVADNENLPIVRLKRAA